MRATERGALRRDVLVETGDARLEGELALPEQALGVVVFAHGSGSSRFSPRNRLVASVLQEARLGTLLFDLLTEAEDRVDRRTAEHRFDIPLLTRRLLGALEWVGVQREAHDLPLGLFGASTGAAAALIAAADSPETVRAVVSRGGRPDLAGPALEEVRAPTLLIVGALDDYVIGVNRLAAARLPAPHRLSLVPGATHLFEEPGALEQVANLARAWLVEHLAPDAGAA
ncbi:MAG: dienelactone hydrolase family protein [Planctomycetota bacterium]